MKKSNSKPIPLKAKNQMFREELLKLLQTIKLDKSFQLVRLMETVWLKPDNQIPALLDLMEIPKTQHSQLH